MFWKRYLISIVLLGLTFFLFHYVTKDVGFVENKEFINSGFDKYCQAFIAWVVILFLGLIFGGDFFNRLSLRFKTKTEIGTGLYFSILIAAILSYLACYVKVNFLVTSVLIPIAGFLSLSPCWFSKAERKEWDKKESKILIIILIFLFVVGCVAFLFFTSLPFKEALAILGAAAGFSLLFSFFIHIMNKGMSTSSAKSKNLSD